MKPFLILLSALLITSCTFSGASEKKQTEPEDYDDTFYNYWPTESDPKILYETITLEEEGFTGEFPAISNLEDTHVLTAVTQNYRQQVETAQQEQKEYAAELAAKDSEVFANPYDYSVAWLGGRYHPALWSLAFQVYSYTGGAHGNHWTDTYNYHPKTNRLLKLEDLFTDPKAWEILDTAVLAGLISEKQKRWDQSNNNESYDSTQDFFMEELEFNAETLNSWVVTKKEGLNGILFFFAPYAVGPYAEGGYEVFVPIAVVQEFVKEEYKEIFQ